MNKELEQIENLIFKPNRLKVKNIIKDQESEEYHGINFQIEKLNIKFRKAKITPKKVGQFVTLWKRDAEKHTEPFNESDNFSFYIVVTEQDNKLGFFFFPKAILSQKQILTKNEKKGKRGFRVYPDWTNTQNKQAQKTQTWQTKYFIDLTNNKEKSIEKFNFILSKNPIEV